MHKSIIDRLPEDHFGSVSQKVLHKITNGQSCSVYGLPGYGMDFFARHIVELMHTYQPSLQIFHLNLQFENDKVRLLQRRFAKQIGEKEIDEMHLVEYLKKNRIIIVLGEVYSSNYPKLFKYLAALYSINPSNMSILTVANYTIFKHAKKYRKYGKHIFTPNVLIPNFDRKGVRRIIQINNEEHNWNTPLRLTNKIYTLSGGNPALVRNISMALYEEGENMIDHVNKLAMYQSINFRLAELADLITKLTIEEQMRIGLLNKDASPFCTLLKEFLKINEMQGLGTMFPSLSQTERRVLSVFIQNSDKIITKDQLSLILHQTVDTYSEWAIYKAIARLREKVKGKFKIITIRNRGWKLKNV